MQVKKEVKHFTAKISQKVNCKKQKTRAIEYF